MPITWGDKAERHLMLAMLLHSKGPSSGPHTVRVGWEAVVETMNSMGYSTTKEAVSQRWQKRLVPDLRKSNPELFKNSSVETAGAATAGASDSKPSTPRKRMRKAAKAANAANAAYAANAANAAANDADTTDTADNEIDQADEQPSAKKRKQEDYSSMAGADDESA
ncbi:hypothetical protein F4820DRAFT_358315 [Hypoxylon rubiginosum]|uniref:Uncharacterized protein n=1 Tax=Hypoxylon rubiginosum TaxID=110542 RepID=A0ACB9YYQ6_9PEZI|nr:hypothetical protein F4820DRAFT_358315 [Hypoxylon rubiginosum]